MFKNRISADTERRREKRSSQKKIRSWRGGGENVRTCCHVRHFPDLPFGEITIEGTSSEKHCTITTKKSPTIKMG